MKQAADFPADKPIDLQIPHEHLIRLISRHGESAIRSRQVTQRLRTLLPERFQKVKLDLQASSMKPSAANRLALIDAQYQAFINELVDMSSQALMSRIQYETHMMLLEARRCLRSVTRR